MRCLENAPAFSMVVDTDRAKGLEADACESLCFKFTVCPGHLTASALRDALSPSLLRLHRLAHPHVARATINVRRQPLPRRPPLRICPRSPRRMPRTVASSTPINPLRDVDRRRPSGAWLSSPSACLAACGRVSPLAR